MLLKDSKFNIVFYTISYSLLLDTVVLNSHWNLVDHMFLCMLYRISFTYLVSQNFYSGKRKLQILTTKNSSSKIQGKTNRNKNAKIKQITWQHISKLLFYYFIIAFYILLHTLLIHINYDRVLVCFLVNFVFCTGF